MPLLGGIIASLFSSIFAYLSARLTFNVAFGLAVAATVVAAIAALKAVLYGVWSGIALTVPAGVVVALANVAPSNLNTCIASIVIIDVVICSFDYWRLTAGLVIGAMGK